MRFARAFVLLAVLGFVALVAGCATAPGPNCVRLSASGFFCLLPPAALPARDGTALVTVARKDVTRHFVGQLSITQRKLTLALYNLAGVPVATLHWDGRKAMIDAPEKPPMKARQLTALLELSLAKPTTLDKALYGLHLTTRAGATKQERRLRAGRTLVARAITSKEGNMHIRVPRLDLDITLEPVKKAADE